jgi:hypothetical protein
VAKWTLQGCFRCGQNSVLRARRLHVSLSHRRASGQRHDGPHPRHCLSLTVSSFLPRQLTPQPIQTPGRCQPDLSRQMHDRLSYNPESILTTGPFPWTSRPFGSEIILNECIGLLSSTQQDHKKPPKSSFEHSKSLSDALEMCRGHDKRRDARRNSPSVPKVRPAALPKLIVFSCTRCAPGERVHRVGCFTESEPEPVREPQRRMS